MMLRGEPIGAVSCQNAMLIVSLVNLHGRHSWNGKGDGKVSNRI